MKTIILAIVGKEKTDLIIEKDWQKLEELQKSFPMETFIQYIQCREMWAI